VKNNNNNNLKAHCLSLDNIALTSLLDSLIALVVMDISIKNQVATLIMHIHCQDCPIVKTIHYTINVTSIEAKLFAIRCSINQATQLQEINKIIIITDSIHSANKILDYSLHSHQVHSAAISHELQEFSVLITPTLSNSGSPQITANGSFIMQSILKPENISKIHLSHGELCGTLAKKESVMVLLANGK